MNDWKRFSAYEKILSLGHIYPPADSCSPYTAKPGSHDDGPKTGLFLGGIGAPVISRSLDGRFSRWHLQTGYHVHQPIDSAFLGLRWKLQQKSLPQGYMRLDDSGAADAGMSRRVSSLFPVMQEHYFGGQVPAEVRAEFFSPIVPGDELLSVLPVWYADIAVRNVSDSPLEIDAALFLPNMLGWKVQQMTAADRPDASWPGQTHAGNTGRSFSILSGADESAKMSQPLPSAGFPEQMESGLMGNSAEGVGVLQQRYPDYLPQDSDSSIPEEMEGETALFAFRQREENCTHNGKDDKETGRGGGSNWRVSTEACFKAGQNLVDRPPEQQKHTIAWAEQQFAETGVLPQTGLTWRAHWDEALGSAAAQGMRLEPGESTVLHFCVAYDLPTVVFGSGRKWFRKYTEQFGTSGRNAEEMAVYAASVRSRVRAGIAAWQKTVLQENSHLPQQLKAAMINELYIINGGGTVWVSGSPDQPGQGLNKPLLGSGEHAGILEGFDIGYYYYNTSDIWPYSWYAISRWWPKFSDCVFADYIRTIPLEIPEQHMIYRTETMAPILVRGKIPHDFGSVMEDPWHRINGYQMRDDSNVWKDHNPGFIISLYLHRKLVGFPGSDTAGAGLDRPGQTEQQKTEQQKAEQQKAEQQAVREAGEFMFSQLDKRTGLPYHDAFGDSTWDNLGIRGTAAFSGSLTLAALAALIRQHDGKRPGNASDEDREFVQRCRKLLEKGIQSFNSSLWNGSYYRMSDSGKYADCIMADGILGFYFADLAGLLDLLPGISRKSLKSHLRAVYTYNFKGYEQGACGPLLVASEQKTHFSGDGGDELQVNEVLTGSAWMTAAMMHHFGLEKEGNEIAESVRQVLYERSGLQFRTPAAYDAYGKFRAPINLRPLSVWFLDEQKLKQ